MFFKVGDAVVVDYPYVNNILSKNTHLFLRPTLERLGHLSGDGNKIVEIGSIPANHIEPVRYFVKIEIIERSSPAFNEGRGVVLYFLEEEQINRSFVLISKKTFSLPESFYILNNLPGIVIPSFCLVRLCGYSRVVEAHAAELVTNSNQRLDIQNLALSQELILPGLVGNATTLF